MERTEPLDVRGGTAVDMLDGTVEVEPVNLTGQFIAAHTELALRLHYTVGMQEFISGAAQSSRIVGDKRKTREEASAVLHDADRFFEATLATLPEDQRLDLERKVMGWAVVRPPFGADFSEEDRDAVELFTESPLVQMYLEFMPH